MFGWFKKIPTQGLAKKGLALFFLLSLLYFLYFWRLGILTVGLSPAEAAARTASGSLSEIANNPIYAPHKLLQFVSQKLFGNGAADLRIVSSLSAVFFIFCFYHLVRGWFGKMVGFFATLFLAAVPWFVLSARSATPTILLLAPLAILSCYYWAGRTKNVLAFYLLIAVASLSLYVPGIVWLAIFGLIIGRQSLRGLMEEVSKLHKFIGAFAGTALIAPLVYASFKNFTVAKDLLLIPREWPSLIITVKSIAWSFLALFWRAPTHGDFMIGRLPMLNVAQIALVLFGCFALWKLARNKSYTLIALACFGVVVSGINQNLFLLTLSLSAIAVAVAAGLRYLYMEWRTVFPKNPIPKYMAIGLIAALSALQIGYGLRYGLIAWPHTADTRTTYVIK